MPRTRYEAGISSGQIIRDTDQQNVVDKLDQLMSMLETTPESESSLRAKLTGVFKRRPDPINGVRGLYVWGSVGRGKTFLMDAFYECLSIKRKQRLHFHYFMHEVHGVLKTVKDAPDPLSLVAAHFKRNARVLCLDELFVSDIADAMILDGLLRALFCQGITLVTTTNLPPDDLYKNGLQRQRFLPAIDLLKQHTEVVHLGGSTDHRLQFLETADIYHTPVDARADEILCNNFLHVAPDKGTQGEILNVENRTIPTIRCSEGVVWFHFSDICDGPRSAADYIEIARCFNTVLISGVPVFCNQDDLARRFITLVDEFYDRSVNLILTAEAPPEQLYQHGRLEFEFQRTTSRLVEMQSKEYLAQAHKSI